MGQCCSKKQDAGMDGASPSARPQTRNPSQAATMKSQPAAEDGA